MLPWGHFESTPGLRRIAHCLLPLVLGTGATLVLLLLASEPARPAYAGTLTFPGCAATIQGCINIANPGDTILISAGDYTESLTLNKAVSLTGALSSTTILHALPNTRVLTVTGAAVDSSAVISGLTFTGGLVTGTQTCPDSCGGAILITGGAQPLLSNLQLSGNTAGFDGGGIYASGAIILTAGRFIGNSAYGGGGLYTAGAVTVTNSSFVNNRATGLVSQGGGLATFDTAMLAGTQFVSNTASLGGGLYVGGAATLVGASFVGNTAAAGGGIYAPPVPITVLLVTGSSFVSNTATNTGGGLDAEGTVIVTTSSFLSNTAGSIGGGLEAGNSASLGVLVSDTQFINNSGGGAEISSRSTVISSSFVSNIGGGLIANGGGTVISSSFISNLYGGGLYAVGAVTVTASSFLSNTGNVSGRSHSARPPSCEAQRPTATIASTWSRPLNGCSNPSVKLMCE